jgi:signal transduction histidine kinase
MGGEISVRSKLGVGSQFIVRLPVVSQKVEEPVG